MIPERMRAAVYYNNHDVRLEERPVPRIGPGEILVKIIASGICGSDVLEWYRVRKAPIVLGHEIAGEVVRVGEGVDKVKVGDRVFVGHHVPCNTCRYCRAGSTPAARRCRTPISIRADSAGMSARRRSTSPAARLSCPMKSRGMRAVSWNRWPVWCAASV